MARRSAYVCSMVFSQAAGVVAPFSTGMYFRMGTIFSLTLCVISIAARSLEEFYAEHQPVIL